MWRKRATVRGARLLRLYSCCRCVVCGGVWAWVRRAAGDGPEDFFFLL